MSGLERAALLLAVVFIGFGIYSIIWPKESLVMHPDQTRYRSVLRGSPPPERLTKAGTRVYGVVSIGLGVGLGWVLLRPARS